MTFNLRNLKNSLTSRSIPLGWCIGLVAAGVVAITLVIYLTPLHYLSIVDPKVKDIDPVLAYDQMQKNSDGYLFIDVRQQSAYDAGHASGAINIPLQNFYTEHYQLPKHGKEIVLICSGGIASGVAFGYLQHYGFLNVVRIEGGIENWKAHNLPVVVTAK
jgi:rhodanese-related sulfurtransferase